MKTWCMWREFDDLNTPNIKSECWQIETSHVHYLLQVFTCHLCRSPSTITNINTNKCHSVFPAARWCRPENHHTSEALWLVQSVLTPPLWFVGGVIGELAQPYYLHTDWPIIKKVWQSEGLNPAHYLLLWLCLLHRCTWKKTHLMTFLLRYSNIILMSWPHLSPGCVPLWHHCWRHQEASAARHSPRLLRLSAPPQ